VPFALIGDVVGSRSLPDRGLAQRRIESALRAVSREIEADQPLEPTVGDEFQGVFTSLTAAVAASLRVRLELLPEIDVRCGIGQGDLTVHDARRRPVLQDGPAWWAARAALQRLAKPPQPTTRTWFSGLEQDHVNAYLLTRDALVDRFNPRHLRMLRMALAGRTQAEIADAEKVSRSAVSQAFAHGVGAVRDAALVFEGAA
jgi:DNA-binding CsgD family transcriptional regulator